MENVTGNCTSTKKDITVKAFFDGNQSGQQAQMIPIEDGMNVSRAMGAELTDSQVKSILEGKKTLIKGLKGKKSSYDAYLMPEGTTDYSYTKDGKEIKGFQYKVKQEFPKKKNREE